MQFHQKMHGDFGGGGKGGAGGIGGEIGGAAVEIRCMAAQLVSTPAAAGHALVI